MDNRANSHLRNYRKIDIETSRMLDSLRGLSALTVLIAHAFQIFIAPINSSAYGVFGVAAQSAVMLFFSLSGFLITKSITENYENFKISSYFKARANRLLPPLFASLTICIILWLIAPLIFVSGTRDFLRISELMARDGFYINVKAVTGTAFFLNGFITKNISSNAPLWSLPYEAWYYAAAGIAAYLKGRRGAAASALLIISLGMLSKTFLIYSIVWISGSIACIAHNNRLFSARLILGLTLTLSIPSLAIGAYYAHSTSNITSSLDVNLKIITLYNLICGILSSILILGISEKLYRFPSIFSGSARYSYTLYITHFPIMLFLYGVAQPNLKSLYSSILFSMASSAFCIVFSKLLSERIESAKIFKPIGAGAIHSNI